MEKKNVDIEKKELEVVKAKLITRKEAIKKTGLIAVTAATTMILLGSPKAQACSPAPPPDDHHHHHDDGGHNTPWH